MNNKDTINSQKANDCDFEVCENGREVKCVHCGKVYRLAQSARMATHAAKQHGVDALANRTKRLLAE